MESGNRILLIVVLLAYAGLGVLYAAYTPPWQVPDEPAHYNYIRALVEDGALPVIEEGDYDQAYLEQLTGQRFPPGLSIEPLTYEDHQPPLYYLLAAPVYLLFDGALLPLRLLSVVLGAALLVVAHGLVHTLFPDRPTLALTATALIALLPQHLAMTAGVENDALAELLVAVALWMAVRYTGGEVGGRRYLIGWGLTLGLAVLTKTTAYVALPTALAAIGLRARREGRSFGWASAQAGRVLLAAALLAGPWLVRNVTTYGWTDPLGLARHNAVVVGQPRTVEWLAEYGWGNLLGRMARFTFQSFWAQLGWMAVPLPSPVYVTLLLFTGLLTAGFLGWLADRRRPRLLPPQRDGMQSLATSALLTLALYLSYNATFVQHQGRYLFPALVPLALAAALGLEWLLSPNTGRRAALGLAGAGVLLLAWGMARGDPATIPAAAAFGMAALFAPAVLWPFWGRRLAPMAFAIGLAALDLYALFGAVVPALAR